VKIADTDLSGGLFYANYFRIFSEAKDEFFERLFGLNINELLKSRGFVLLTVEAHSKFYQPVKYPSTIVINIYPEIAGRKAIKLNYQVVDDGETTLAEGYTISVMVDKEHRTAVELPIDIKEKLSSY
jgi:acyl-CoA thioesterase FadM